MEQIEEEPRKDKGGKCEKESWTGLDWAVSLAFFCSKMDFLLCLTQTD